MHSLATNDLENLVCGALETMAFIVLEPKSEGSFEGDTAEGVAASIRFTVGDEHFEVRIGASNGFSNEFGSALLGISPEEFSASGEGVLAIQELANILAGEILRVMAESGTWTRLELPSSVDLVTAVAGDPVTHGWFDYVGEPLSVALHQVD